MMRNPKGLLGASRTEGEGTVHGLDLLEFKGDNLCLLIVKVLRELAGN